MHIEKYLFYCQIIPSVKRVTNAAGDEADLFIRE
jgi:hypothetical protein